MSRNKKPATCANRDGLPNGGYNHQKAIAQPQHVKHSPTLAGMKAHAVLMALPATLAGILFLIAAGLLLEVLR